MVFSMLATAVPALAAPPASSCTYSIEADKTSANPGDTINFTIYMQQTGNQNTLEGTLVIPDGLTFVTGSGKLEDGIKTTLGWDSVEWTPVPNMILNGFGSESFTGTDKLALMKFQCTVDNDATAKDYEVTLIDLVADDENYDTKNPTCIPATVNVTVPHTHVYDQEVATAEHLKTAATCTAAAVYYKSCTCGENGEETFTSGSTLGHDYTKKVENNTYLKTAASNCTEYNVYWYACSRCDANAKDDAAATDKYYTSTTAGNHSFTEKIEDAAHYVAGTGTDCQSVKKYYYDCAYCDQIGTTTWDSTTYGPHNYAATWSSDADGHWHECSLCHDKKDNEAHTPGAAATETTPQKCTECDYIITPALGHTHHMTPVAAKAATCTENGNKAYYVCSGCSKWFEDATGNVEITDHDSVVLTALGHEYTEKVMDDAHKKDTAADCRSHDTYWYDCTRGDHNAKDDPAASDKWYESTNAGSHSYDESAWGYKGADGHAHKCRYDDTHDTPVAHTPGAAATETTPQTCTECGYIITPALGHTHSMTKVDANPASCTEKGNIEYYKCDGCGKLFADATGNVELTADQVVVAATGHDYKWKIDKEATATEKGSKHEECKRCGDKKAAVEIPATGTPTTPTEPADTKSPQTGDNSNMILWIALLFVSGGVLAGTTLYSRKRKSVK